MTQLVDTYRNHECFIEKKVGVKWSIVSERFFKNQHLPTPSTPPPTPSTPSTPSTPPPTPASSTPPPTQSALRNELEIAHGLLRRQRVQLIESQKRVLECQQLATFYQRADYQSRKLVEYYKNIAVNTKQSENAVDDLLKKVKDSTLISLTKASKLTDESQKKTAMKQLKFQLHPDKHPDDLSWLFTEMFKIVNV
jgi:hypothetical protein